MFAEAIEAILIEQCSPAAVRAAEAQASAQPLARALAEAGFHELMAPEEAGGAGAGWPELFEIVLLCGAYAVPLPFAQTLAARALVAAPQDLPEGLLTFVPALARSPGGALRAFNVPAAKTAAHALAADGDGLLLLSLDEAERFPNGIHGSLAESLAWPAGSGWRVAGTVDAECFLGIGALLHAGLLAGAMKRVFTLTMAYANERVQFGKPIGKFQAIQHQLSVMAEHVAAGSMAAEAAFSSGGRAPALPACAVAKARTSEAAQLVASIAHAVHGAIGVTEEYDLQLYTRRLHEWRMAHGSEDHWNRKLGRLFMESKEDGAVDFVRTLFDGASA